MLVIAGIVILALMTQVSGPVVVAIVAVLTGLALLR